MPVQFASTNREMPFVGLVAKERAKFLDVMLPDIEVRMNDPECAARPRVEFPAFSFLNSVWLFVCDLLLPLDLVTVSANHAQVLGLKHKILIPRLWSNVFNMAVAGRLNRNYPPAVRTEAILCSAVMISDMRPD